MRSPSESVLPFPSRADYQRFLAICLIQSAEHHEDPAMLLRALSILEGLADSGRLSPADQPMLPVVRQMVEQAGIEPAS